MGAAVGASLLTATSRSWSKDRERGRIEERGGSLRVVVYAGLDPVNGRRVYLRETIAGFRSSSKVDGSAAVPVSS